MWIFNDKVVDSVSKMPDDVFGFVYKITNLSNGKIYIGKKQIFSTTKRVFGKKEAAAMIDKRKAKHEYVTKESAWLKYTGSNTALNADIKNGDEVRREILVFCNSKAKMTYFETKYQFLEGVIEKDTYNDNINGKYYRKIFL
jgi:Putative endonuclease segE, GIY-YIG domain